MSTHGRRVGLAIGYSLAICGGLVAGIGAETRTLWIFLTGLFVYGSGQASNLLSRYAAIDLAEPAERSQAMSRILFASTFGAVLGPILVLPAQWAGEQFFGWNKYTGPWVFSGLFFVVSLANVAFRLHPDPLLLAQQLSEHHHDGLTKVSSRDAISEIVATRDGRLAVFSMIVSQMTMVAVMTMTPVHLKAHGHESVSSYVVSLHIAGMYAFSPWVGRFSDRLGRITTIAVGGALLSAATTLAALAGESDVMLFPALWLLGIGWSFGLIGGSSLLVESVGERVRVSVQGLADMAMSFFGGVAGFSSGFIRKAVGYHVLAGIGLVLALAMMSLSYLHSQRVVETSVS